MDYELIIVGGGPGGCAAALYGARGGLSTLLLEQGAAGGQLAVTAWIENYPGISGQSGPELAGQMLEGAKAAGAAAVQAQVTSMDLQGKVKALETTAGIFTAGTVILAMGAAPKKLELPEAAAFLGRGLSYCATCDGRFFRGKTVAVLGGGNSAVASALSLSKLCSQVHVIFRKPEMRADSAGQAALAAAKNIVLHPQTQLLELRGKEILEELVLKDQKTPQPWSLPCQGLFVEIGRVPETKLVQGQVALNEAGYVEAGENTQTTLPGVYAVGDIRTKPLRQVVTAAADGAVAAQQAAAYLSH